MQFVSKHIRSLTTSQPTSVFWSDKFYQIVVCFLSRDSFHFTKSCSATDVRIMVPCYPLSEISNTCGRFAALVINFERLSARYSRNKTWVELADVIGPVAGRAPLPSVRTGTHLPSI